MLQSIGFVPVIDGLLSEWGSLHAAYLYGYIWVHKTSDSKFNEPLEQVAKKISMGRSTVFKWVRWLCDNDYLQDLTPDIEGRAHTYLITGKAQLGASIIFTSTRHDPSKYRRLPVHQTDGDPSTSWTPGGPPNGPHDHDGDHDIHEIIYTGYQALGLGLEYFDSLLKRWDGHYADLSRVIQMWLDADERGDIPDEWGPPLIYKKIKDGEAPPDERPLKIGDEVMQMMELQQKGKES